jgi:hypothetical protein
MRRPLVDILIGIYVRYFLKIERDGDVKLSLLANILIGIGYGITGCLLLIAADAQMAR